MSSTNSISVSLDNPYSHVTIPRAKLRSSGDATVIANPAAFNNNNNPYDVTGGGGANSEQPGSAPPPPYMVKEDGREEGGGRGCPACCYRCRRK